MIHLQMNGFIADNLFQYAIARILAEDLGYALEISYPNMRPQVYVPRLLEFFSRFRDAPLSLPGRSFDHPLDKTAFIGEGSFDGFHLNLEAMRQCRDDRKILMRGYYQRYELLRPHKDRIRSWFAMESSDLGYDVSEDDIVIHIRRGDFIVFGFALSLGFYTKLLETLDFRKLYICGYGLGSEVRRAFKCYDPVYVHCEAADDFAFMMGFNRMIQSNSGFSWWAGFLSQAREIYAPIAVSDEQRNDPKNRLADLRVDDESRYHYIYDVPYLERPYTLRDIFDSRRQLRKKRILSSIRQLVLRRFS